MSWQQRGQGITGSNNIPLGRRRFGGDDEESTPPTDSLKRGRSPVRCNLLASPLTQPITNTVLAHDVDDAVNAAVDGAKRRKKKNRWGDATENKAAGLMGLTTAVAAGMTDEQLEGYSLNLRVEEISQKLRINDVVPAEGDRYVPRSSPRNPSLSELMNLLGLLPLLLSTTTLADVSIPASTVTASALKKNVTSSSSRP